MCASLSLVLRAGLATNNWKCAVRQSKLLQLGGYGNRVRPMCKSYGRAGKHIQQENGKPRDLVSDRLHDEFRPCDGRHDIRRFTLAKRQLDILTRSGETKVAVT